MEDKDKITFANKLKNTISVDDDPGQYYVHPTEALQLKKEGEINIEEVGAVMSRRQIAARLPDTEFLHTSNGAIPVQPSPEEKEELVKSLVSTWVNGFGKDKLIESYINHNPKLVEGLSDEAIEIKMMDGLNKLASNSIDLGRAIRMQNSWCFSQERFYPENATKVIDHLSEFLHKDGTLDLYTIINRSKPDVTPEE